MKRLAILGELNPSSETHVATNSAIEHSKKVLKIDLDVSWISTDEISESLLKLFNGYFVAPGSPYKDMEKALFAIEYARENNIPILGTCGGFQHMIIEYARNVLGYKDAQHAEYDPYASELFISELACCLRGREPLCFRQSKKDGGFGGGRHSGMKKCKSIIRQLLGLGQ